MKRLTTILLINLGIIAGAVNAARGQGAPIPEELTETISGIEAAANDRDLDELLDYYSEDFTNTDGLTTATLAKAVEQMWQEYPELTYTTEIESWSREGDELVAETKTTIEGMNAEANTRQLSSTIKSRQYFQDRELVRQEILAEQSRLSSGVNPPQVNIIAPNSVETGEKYNFDLIVDEPLGDRVLLGAVQEEKTAGNLYLNPIELELELLPAGGIYKVATAPLLPDSNWLSAILVRGDGITRITHRVNVVESSQSEN